MLQLSQRVLDRLTDAFYERLAAVLPAGVSADEITSDIYFQLELINHQGGDVEENVLHMAGMILSDVQDRVIRDIRKGWPPTRLGNSECSGADLPLAETAIIDSQIHLWFGDEGSPDLALKPIPLSVLK